MDPDGPANGLIARATDGRDLIEFNLKSGLVQKTVRLSEMPFRLLAFSPDGKDLAAA